MNRYDRSVVSGNWDVFKNSLGIWIFSIYKGGVYEDADLEDDYKASSVLEILASIVYKKT